MVVVAPPVPEPTFGPDEDATVVAVEVADDDGVDVLGELETTIMSWAWVTSARAAVTFDWYVPRSPAFSAVSASANSLSASARSSSGVPGAVPCVAVVDGLAGVVSFDAG